MKRISITLIIALTTILYFSCAIPRYSETEILPDEYGVFITRIPSVNVFRWDSALAISWCRSFNRNIQIKAAIDKEIDARISRQITTRKLFTGAGGISGFSIAVYTIAVTNPSTTILGLLGLFSGTTFASSLSFLKEDERALLLSEKSRKLDLLRQDAETQLSILEKLLTDKGILVQSGETDLNSNNIPPSKEVINLVDQIKVQTTTFRLSLSTWDQEAK